MNIEERKIPCPICGAENIENCQQTQCVLEFGRCIACLAVNNPIKDLDFNIVMKFLNDNPTK